MIKINEYVVRWIMIKHWGSKEKLGKNVLSLWVFIWIIKSCDLSWFAK